MAEGEETFFSYLRERPENAYARCSLRAAMEATMSAPTYFTPMERFVDGGTTTYNNPSLAALLEAVQYGPPQYEIGRLTMFSFGTGCRTQLIAPEQVPNPPGPDVAFWLDWLMTESGNDAARTCRATCLRASRVTSGCDYRRFQISLDREAVAKLPDVALGHRRWHGSAASERADRQRAFADQARQRRLFPGHASDRLGGGAVFCGATPKKPEPADFQLRPDRRRGPRAARDAARRRRAHRSPDERSGLGRSLAGVKSAIPPAAQHMQKAGSDLRSTFRAGAHGALRADALCAGQARSRISFTRLVVTAFDWKEGVV